jgi:hypothetical protein
MKFDPLHNFISPVTGRVMADKRDYILLGNDNGVGIPSPILIDVRLDLQQVVNKVEKFSSLSFLLKELNSVAPNAQALNSLDTGFMFNTSGVVSTVAIENLAPSDAKYILQQANEKLPNAQGLSELGGGMLKTTELSNGAMSIASGGGTPFIDDYVDPFTLQTNIAETKVFASAAAAAAEVAAVASSAAYFHLQMLPYIPSPIPLIGSIGAQITSAIGVVGAVAAVAKSTADEAIILIDNLEVTLEGEAYGTGKIKNAIQTKVGFSFFSKADIPLNPHLGMLLFVEN